MCYGTDSNLYTGIQSKGEGKPGFLIQNSTAIQYPDDNIFRFQSTSKKARTPHRGYAPVHMRRPAIFLRYGEVIETLSKVAVAAAEVLPLVTANPM